MLPYAILFLDKNEHTDLKLSKRILIGEDEIALQETLSYNLEREGYRVTVEGDGIKALEPAQETEP